MKIVEKAVSQEKKRVEATSQELADALAVLGGRLNAAVGAK